jgi:hypothetical protein
LKKKKIVKKRNKKWFDYDLNTMKRLVDEKAKLMSKFPKAFQKYLVGKSFNPDVSF